MGGPRIRLNRKRANRNAVLAAIKRFERERLTHGAALLTEAKGLGQRMRTAR